jgi:hypothetical protein
MPLIDRELPWPPIPSGTYRARGSASWRLSGADLPFTSWRQLPGNTPGPLMVGARQSSSVRQGPRPWLHYWLPRKRLVESSDYVDRDLHGRRRSSVLKPVCSVLILGPAHSRPILSNHPISMVSDRSLKYVDHALQLRADLGQGLRESLCARRALPRSSAHRRDPRRRHWRES